jgi:hypothetical protein
MDPSMCTLWMVVLSLGVLRVLVCSYCCSSYGNANPYSSLSPFSSYSIMDPVLSPKVGCKHPPQYLSGSVRASQETAISGSYQQVLVGIHNSVWVWWLYMGWILRWDSLWMAFPSVSALHFVTAPMGILFPLLKEDQSIHTLVIRRPPLK